MSPNTADGTEQTRKLGAFQIKPLVLMTGSTLV